MQFKDYYKLLGVDAGASSDEIRKAYRRLARKYHPDVSKQANAEERFKEIGEAYEVLRDPEKRKAYDNLRRGGWRGGEDFTPPPDWDTASFDFGGRGGGFSDFFESLFGGLGAGGRGQPRGFGGSRRPADARARIELDLETAYRGGVRRLTVDGPDGPRSLEVRIPAGITDGKTIRLRGQGPPGPAGRGDLRLVVSLAPHPLFRVAGKHIEMDLPVAPWEAALGGEVNVPTLDGEVRLRIPPGSRAGQRLRLRGRGLAGSPRGDQFVSLSIVAPPADSEEQRDFYRRMAALFPADPRAELHRRAGTS